MFARPYEIFLTVCVTKSFTKAAQRLNISQSAVSQSILGLEKELGFELFDRTTRPLRLTEEAAVLENELSFQLENFAQTIGTLKTKNFIRPALRVAMVESMAYLMAPELFKSMLGRCSKVLLYSGLTNDLVAKLVTGEVDYAIVSDYAPVDARLERLNIFSEPQVLVLPKELASQSESWDLASLQVCGVPFVRYTLNTASNRQSLEVLSDFESHMPNRMQVDSNRLVFKLVEAGMAWSISQPVSLLAEGESIFERISALPLNVKPAATRTLRVVSRKGQSNIWLRALRDLCQEVFKRDIIPAIERIIPWAASEMSVSAESEIRQNARVR
ncbi:MAG TPA: hypothetical protein DCW60_04120 [Sutterella sp.]|nr:hypothetical protein [Sutterella sp.]